MKRILRVQHLEGYRVELSFDNGETGVVDLSHLAGRGVFEEWRDPAVFRAVSIGERGELVWPGGLDLCPDSLYLRATGKRPSDLFPALQHETLHA